jgi:CheY-like chemotaxis protein
MEGISAATAVHGQHALEVLASRSELPRLILLDLNMDVMSGKEFLEQVHQQGGRLGEIPIVLMTAVPDPQVAGVEAILKKPLDLDVLLRTVADFVHVTER